MLFSLAKPYWHVSIKKPHRQKRWKIKILCSTIFCWMRTISCTTKKSRTHVPFRKKCLDNHRKFDVYNSRNCFKSCPKPIYFWSDFQTVSLFCNNERRRFGNFSFILGHQMQKELAKGNFKRWWCIIHTINFQLTHWRV